MCPKCYEKYRPNVAGPECIVVLPLQDKILYEVKCSSGHITPTLIQNYKFEILFELGINAIRNKNYTGAIANFQSALERFYEFSIMYFLCRNVVYVGTGLYDTAYEEFKKTWNLLSKQSERQLGAFYTLYFKEFGDAPIIFNNAFLKSHNLSIKGENDPVAFRNKVIHQGIIPNYEQAVKYGEGVNKYIHTLSKKFLEFDYQRVYDVITINYHKAWDEYGGKVNPYASTGLTLFMGIIQPTYMDIEPTTLSLFPI
jgi:tetratricopeptide (TPR) repeat protein